MIIMLSMIKSMMSMLTSLMIMTMMIMVLYYYSVVVGIVTFTGAQLIKQARELVEQVVIVVVSLVISFMIWLLLGYWLFHFIITLHKHLSF